MAEILYGIKKVLIQELDPSTGLPKSGSQPIEIQTSESAELEPVYSNGEEKVLRDDDRILAIARTEDLLYGYNLKLVDNTFNIEAASLIEGGTIIKDENQEIIGYDSPKLADGVTMKPFKCTLYVANYEGDMIKNYAKVELNKCIGKAPKISFKKDFFAPEFEIKARENTKANLPIKTITFVDNLNS